MIGFYNRDEKCLQCGTYWGFKYSGLRLVGKGLDTSKHCFVFKGLNRTLSLDDVLFVTQYTHKNCSSLYNTS